MLYRQKPPIGIDDIAVIRGPTIKQLKALILAGGVFAALGQAAYAAPSLSYEFFQDGTLIATSTSTTGFLSTSGSNTLFSVLQLNVSGAPILPSPNLDTSTTSISTSSSFTGTHTLQVLISQTGLTSPVNVFNIADTIDLNNLSGAGVNSTITDYINTNNALFGTTTAFASLTGVAGANVTNGVSGVVATVNSGSGPYSETEVLSATFTGPNQVLNTSMQLVFVPEPASLALVGTALVGFGLIRRRRNRA